MSAGESGARGARSRRGRRRAASAQYNIGCVCAKCDEEVHIVSLTLALNIPVLRRKEGRGAVGLVAIGPIPITSVVIRKRGFDVINMRRNERDINAGTASRTCWVDQVHLDQGATLAVSEALSGLQVCNTSKYVINSVVLSSRYILTIQNQAWGSIATLVDKLYGMRFASTHFKSTKNCKEEGEKE